MNHQHGEHILQEKYGTMKQAAAFYNNQMIDHLNEVMRVYISKQDMMFISTADSRGIVILPFVREHRVLSGSLMSIN